MVMARLSMVSVYKMATTGETVDAIIANCLLRMKYVLLRQMLKSSMMLSILHNVRCLHVLSSSSFLFTVSIMSDTGMLVNTDDTS